MEWINLFTLSTLSKLQVWDIVLSYQNLARLFHNVLFQNPNYVYIHKNLSPVCYVFTEITDFVLLCLAEEPMNGEHLHKAIFLENLDKLESVLETGSVAPSVSSVQRISQIEYVDTSDVESRTKIM